MLLLQASTPFFSNTADGWIRLAGFGLTVVLTLSGVWYTLHVRPIKHRLDEMDEADNPKAVARRTELNEWGRKVNELERKAEGREQRLVAQERTVAEQGRDIKGMIEDMSEIRAWMETCNRDTLGMKQEIIGFVSARFDQVMDKVQDVNLQLARYGERQDQVKQDVAELKARTK
jgi:hypothetical protein